MKKMKLKHIINFLEFTADVEIYNWGENIDKSDPEEPCFVGAVMDIPWYFMDYYLYCPNSYQAIDVYKPEDDNHARFSICLIDELKED